MEVRFKEDTTHIQDLEGVLKSKITGRIVDHQVQPLIAYGENFGSEILKVDVTVEENGEKKQVHAVAKLIPPTQMQMEIFNTQVTFKNEIGFYAEIVPALLEFEREYGASSIADYVPKFYGGRISLNPNSSEVDENGVLIMENLKVSGYTNIDRLKGFDLDGAKAVLRVLATFQATLLALRKKKPEVFASQIRPYLVEWKAPDLFSLNFDSVLKENPNTSHLIQRVRKALAKKRFKKIREPWATIVHNDLWVNNIMVQETNGIIDGIKLVDFQVADLGSPAEDIIFFLFSSVQTSVVHYHFEKLLRHYYNEFIKVLQLFKIDIKEFTYESFQEELRQESAYQVIHALFMLVPIFGPKEAQRRPGKAPQWNPNGVVGASNGHAGPPPESQKGPTGPPQFKCSLPLKEKVWFIAEEAAKRKWI